MSEPQLSYNPVQTVGEFMADSRDELLEFERFWLKMNKESPDAFPISMHAGEWYEQFISWLETAP